MFHKTIYEMIREYFFRDSSLALQFNYWLSEISHQYFNYPTSSLNSFNIRRNIYPFIFVDLKNGLFCDHVTGEMGDIFSSEFRISKFELNNTLKNITEFFSNPILIFMSGPDYITLGFLHLCTRIKFHYKRKIESSVNICRSMRKES
jgi:hypothetical protein